MGATGVGGTVGEGVSGVGGKGLGVRVAVGGGAGVGVDVEAGAGAQALNTMKRVKIQRCRIIQSLS